MPGDPPGIFHSFNNVCQSCRSMTSGGKALTGDRLITDTPRLRHCGAAKRNEGSIRRAKLRASRLVCGV